MSPVSGESPDLHRHADVSGSSDGPDPDRVRLIHVVSDDHAQSEWLVSVLREEGYQVLLFTVLEDFRAAFAGTTRPDAVVLDMIPPEGGGAGAERLGELQAGQARLPPVVFVSGRDDLDARLAAHRAGASRYLLKPAAPDRLIEVLDELTGRTPRLAYRVLLVDDDPALLEVEAAVLRAAGMTVLTLSQARDALDRMDTFCPDVVVMDVYMPEVTGPELAAIIRERDACPGPPILFLSAEADIDKQLKALSLGGDDFLVKPVQPEHLVSAVTARACRARRSAAMQQRLQTTLYEREREQLALDCHALVSVTDGTGTITQVNSRFCQVSGYRREELLGQNHRIIKSGEHTPAFYQALWRTIAKGEVWQGEICNRRKDGTLYWVSSTITPFLDGSGRPYQYVSIRTDITDVKAREARQRSQNAMRAVIGTVAARLLSASADTIDAVIEEVLGLAGEHLGTDRAYLFLLSDNDTRVDNTHEWCAPGVAAQKETLQDIALESLPWWRARIHRDQPIIIADAAALPPEASAEKAMLESLGVRALCGFPIRREGKTLGYLGFDQVTGLGQWDAAALDLLGLMASQLGSALLRAAGERTLREQYRFTQGVLDSQAASIAVLDRDGVIVAVNATWRRFATGNAGEAGAPAPNTGLGTNYLDVCRQARTDGVDDAAGLVTGIESVMAGRTARLQHEYPCHEPGEVRWFEMTVTPLSGDDGGVVISHTDITRRKLAEIALSETAGRLNATLESTRDGILAVDRERGVLFMNRQFQRMWNLPESLLDTANEEQLLAHATAQLLEPRGYREAVRALYHSDEDSEDLVELKDGRVFERHSKVLQSDGDTSGRVWVFHDTTERRRAEQAAEQAEDRLRRGQMYANIGTWEWNIITGELFWTERIAPLFGHLEGTLETSYENFLGAVHPDDRQAVMEAVDACLEHGVPYDIEHRVVWPDGTVRWLLEQGAVLRDAEGRPSRMLGIVQDIDARKRLELSLAEREQELVEAQALASLGNWSADQISGRLLWSDEVYRIFGYEPGAITPSIEAFHAAVHPDDRALVREDVERARQSGRHDVVHRIVRPDGSIRHVHELARAEVDEQGQLIRLIGTVQDVTERVEAEQQLRETEQRFAFAVEGAGDGVWDWNMITGEIFLSGNYEPMLGFERGELKPSVEGWKRSVHPDDLESAQRQLEDYLAGRCDQYAVELRMRCKDGNYKWVLSRGTVVERNANGEPVRLVAIHSDIDQRKAGEETLRLFKHVVDSVMDGVIVIDSQGCMQLASPAVSRIFGYSQSAMVGKNVSMLMPERLRPGHDAYIQRYLSTNDARVIDRQVQVTGERADGSEFPLEVTVSEIRIGQSPLFVGLLRDITARKRAESELIAARREADRANKAKSEFLSSMSHELRTPMNAILGFGQLIGYDDDLSEEHQDNVKEILNAGEHLLSLINEVLDLSRIESGTIDLSLEPVALTDVVEECLSLVATLAEPRHIQLAVQGIHGVTVWVDRIRFKQVLLNLLSNAIKYNRDGGNVILSAEPAASGQVRIRVSDTGRGIDEARLSELFQPFNRLGADRSEVEGTGIGLSITRRIVESMGGTVGVHSDVGAGSTFWVHLPLARQAGAAGQSPVRENKAPDIVDDRTSVQTILYIEDNPANLKLVTQILRPLTHVRLITAHSASLGIELALARQPDMILLDINLPGMDGYRVLKRLRAEASLQHTPVIAITANATPADVERGKAVGFTDYLTKPLHVELFLEKIRHGLGLEG